MGHGVIRGNDSWKVSGSFLKTSSVSNERVDRGISRESNDFVSGQISFLSVSSRWRRSLLKFRWRSPWKRGFSAALQLFHGKLRSSLDGISRDSSGILRFQAGRIYFNPFAFLFYPQSMEIIIRFLGNLGIEGKSLCDLVILQTWTFIILLTFSQFCKFIKLCNFVNFANFANTLYFYNFVNFASFEIL